jgi:hypothetical protein
VTRKKVCAVRVLTEHKVWIHCTAKQIAAISENRKVGTGFRGSKELQVTDATSPEGTGQSVARHGSAGYDFTQIESRRGRHNREFYANSLGTPETDP